MSWNNQGGGPWRSPGQGPWGQGPTGPQPPTDLEEWLRRLQQGLRGLTPGGGGGGGGGRGAGRLILVVALVALVAWFALGSFYTVQPNEVGINLVFGRYTGKTAAGLNTNWPWPIGDVIKVPVSDQQLTEVGYRSDAGGADILAESQMLTGDQNIVNVRFRVSWQIDPADPEDFVFNILNPRETVKAVAESIMREVVGLKTIDGVLTSDRKSIEPDVQQRMQTVLNDYHAGVLVKQVQLQSVDAPAQVISAYRDVTAAQQDQQRAVNDAETYANSVVPEAEGRASRILAEAKAYKQQTILDATGPDGALQPDLRPVQERARRHPRAHVSGDDGAGARRNEQDDPRRALGERAGSLSGARPDDPEARGSAEMRNPFSGLAILIAIVAAIVVADYTFFTVDPTEQALVLRFGAAGAATSIGTPGLHARVPFIDTVVYIDKRILALDNERQEVLVAENQRLEVDAFVRYRIADPLLFYQSVFNVKGADAQLGGMLNSALRRTLSEASIVDIVRNHRDALMADIRDQVKIGAARFGLDIVDVRIKRADLPPENSEAVFRRMQAERQRLAATFRAQGSQQSQQIKANADATVTVTVAQAQQQSEQIRGEGDAERNRIFAQAYGADPDFFAFYRSMQAYDAAFKGDTRAILSPKSDFFRYFSNPVPAPAPAATPAAQ